VINRAQIYHGKASSHMSRTDSANAHERVYAVSRPST
jgi:adenosylmethionine-8-amino-7-oxononanoate aminotransferase